MFKYIANYGRVTPCFVNDPSLPPIVQAFRESKMLGPLVRRDNPGIFSTPEAALKALKETVITRKGSLNDAELYTYNDMGVNFYKHIKSSGTKLKLFQFIPNAGVGIEVDVHKDEVYYDFDAMMSNFLRDAMSEVRAFNACNKVELFAQYKSLDLYSIQQLRLMDSFLPKARGIVFDNNRKK